MNEVDEMEVEKAFRAGFEAGLVTDLDVDDAWEKYQVRGDVNDLYD